MSFRNSILEVVLIYLGQFLDWIFFHNGKALKLSLHYIVLLDEIDKIL